MKDQLQFYPWQSCHLFCPPNLMLCILYSNYSTKTWDNYFYAVLETKYDCKASKLLQKSVCRSTMPCGLLLNISKAALFQTHHIKALLTSHPSTSFWLPIFWGTVPGLLGNESSLRSWEKENFKTVVQVWAKTTCDVPTEETAFAFWCWHCIVFIEVNSYFD